MRSVRTPAAISAAVIALLALAVAAPVPGAPGAARADDKPASDPAKPAPKPDAPKPDSAKPDAPKPDSPKPDSPKPDAPKPDADAEARIERAKKVVQELETALATLKASKTPDPEVMRQIEKALEEARKLAKPITLAELTDEEKRSLGEELRKAMEGGEGPAAANPMDGWRERALAAAFKDADLNEEEQIAATKIIQDWFQKSEAARFARDSKQMSDLKSERDKALEKAVGKKKSQKVINNLNSLSGRGR